MYHKWYSLQPDKKWKENSKRKRDENCYFCWTKKKKKYMRFTFGCYFYYIYFLFESFYGYFNFVSNYPMAIMVNQINAQIFLPRKQAINRFICIYVFVDASLFFSFFSLSMLLIKIINKLIFYAVFIFVVVVVVVVLSTILSCLRDAWAKQTYI